MKIGIKIIIAFSFIAITSVGLIGLIGISTAKKKMEAFCEENKIQTTIRGQFNIVLDELGY